MFASSPGLPVGITALVPLHGFLPCVLAETLERVHFSLSWALLRVALLLFVFLELLVLHALPLRVLDALGADG